MTSKAIDYEEIVSLFEELGTVRAVHLRTGIPRAKVSAALKERGITPKMGAPTRRKQVGVDLFECERCHRILANKMFPISNQTRLTYCTNCRRKQVYAQVSSSITSSLRDKYGRTRRRAAASNIPFTITFAEFSQQWLDQKGLCFYTDEPMSWGFGRGRKPDNMSVDKIEPDLGYVSGNVVLCTSRVNTIKHNVTLSEMEDWMPGWYERVKGLRSKGITVYQVAEGAF